MGGAGFFFWCVRLFFSPDRKPGYFFQQAESQNNFFSDKVKASFILITI